MDGPVHRSSSALSYCGACPQEFQCPLLLWCLSTGVPVPSLIVVPVHRSSSALSYCGACPQEFQCPLLLWCLSTGVPVPSLIVVPVHRSSSALSYCGACPQEFQCPLLLWCLHDWNDSVQIGMAGVTWCDMLLVHPTQTVHWWSKQSWCCVPYQLCLQTAIFFLSTSPM